MGKKNIQLGSYPSQGEEECLPPMSLSLLLVPGHLNIASLCCEALIAQPSILVSVKSQVDWDLTRVRVVQRNGNGGII